MRRRAALRSRLVVVVMLASADLFQTASVLCSEHGCAFARSWLSAAVCVSAGGLMDTAFEWVLHNGGIDTERDYKYHAVEGECSINRMHREVVTIDDYDDGAPLSPPRLLLLLMCIVALLRPLRKADGLAFAWLYCFVQVGLASCFAPLACCRTFDDCSQL